MAYPRSPSVVVEALLFTIIPLGRRVFLPSLSQKASGEVKKEQYDTKTRERSSVTKEKTSTVVDPAYLS